MDARLEEFYPDSDDENFVSRPDTEKLVESFIKSPPTKYGVMVGGHGTGKSTLAKRVARKLPGVIYVIIPEETRLIDSTVVSRALDAALRDALNGREPMPEWFPLLLSKFINTATKLLGPGKRAPFCVLIIPRTDQLLSRQRNQ